MDNDLQPLADLTALSRKFGSDTDYVIAGGGNTSVKLDGGKSGAVLCVKASGTALGAIGPEGFVKMDMAALLAMTGKRYPGGNDEVEAAVLADMMAARLAGEEAKRPSVEALLHAIVPYRYVVHTHPALVNGLTCAKNGEAVATEIFAGNLVWLPSMNPGYTLSLRALEAIQAYTASHGAPPSLIFLQNHGIFVGADTPEGICAEYARIFAAIKSRLDTNEEYPARRQRHSSGGGSATVVAESFTAEFIRLAGAAVFVDNAEAARLVQSAASFAPVSAPFTPDHIVYAGSDPLFVTNAWSFAEGETPKLNEASKFCSFIKPAWDAHLRRYGRPPKTAAVQGLGVWGLGMSQKAAALAAALFEDAVKVAAYTRIAGGPLPMTADKIDFINNWEVERYRTSVST
jgi:rhamnose utilization protein RhaD (predicted bifunctional aldolase and dehydrogenase)